MLHPPPPNPSPHGEGGAANKPHHPIRGGVLPPRTPSPEGRGATDKQPYPRIAGGFSPADTLNACGPPGRDQCASAASDDGVIEIRPSTKVKTMKNIKVLALAATGVLLVPALARASTWDIDPAHTSIEFSVRHMMVSTVKGQFEKLKGTLELDDKDVTK